MNQQNIPQKFLCPLTKRLMEDPVIISDGITYERGAISDWIAMALNSPVTNQPLNPQENLVPNYQLKKQIQAWIFTNPQPNQSQNYPPPPPLYYPPSKNLPIYNQPPPAFGQPNPFGQPYGQNSVQSTQIILQKKTVTNNNHPIKRKHKKAAEDACCICLAFTCAIVLECIRCFFKKMI